ncbi:MAG: shikimate dehydrogenase [Prevotellaceae bacterium]|nr:shikimate dehydrogenase [Prevotellaceae bacterium]
MDKYGIIGFPLGHSFSRGFFTEKFTQEGIDAQYLNFEIPDATMLRDVLHHNPELRGLNVTLPHKQAVIPLLDELSDEAREIGAVNVIRVRDGKLKGFNSDIIGFTESIRPLLQPHHTHALILGTGGASRAIRVGLERLGIEWTYVSRKQTTHSSTERVQECPMLNYSDLTPEVMTTHTIIVNCSPVGMFPKTDQAPAIPYELLTSHHLLYDLVYNPEDTLFMKKGRAYGATVKNGLEMLHLQAIASWRFWNE